jgi:hypothetical protein
VRILFQAVVNEDLAGAENHWNTFSKIWSMRLTDLLNQWSEETPSRHFGGRAGA